MKNDVTKIIGYILLSPSLVSVIMFLAQLFTGDKLFKNFMYTIWTGDFSGEGGGGYTSALPFYFGLMAIAGAYLIKDNK
jgi:hypothetical protein